jgi:hypothetical protein
MSSRPHRSPGEGIGPEDRIRLDEVLRRLMEDGDGPEEPDDTSAGHTV